MIVSGVSGVREDYRDARSVFGVWSNTFRRALSVVLTSLTAKNIAVMCLSSLLSQMGAVVQVGRCVVHIWQVACNGIPSGPPPAIFIAHSCPRAGHAGRCVNPEGVPV